VEIVGEFHLITCHNSGMTLVIGNFGGFDLGVVTNLVTPVSVQISPRHLHKDTQPWHRVYQLSVKP
jgi:hypothetical protein